MKVENPEIRYAVEWFKECYPMPDKSGREFYDTLEEAKIAKWEYLNKGYTAWIKSWSVIEECYLY